MSKSKVSIFKEALDEWTGSNGLGRERMFKLMEQALQEEYERGAEYSCHGCRTDKKKGRSSYIGHSCPKLGMLR